MGFDGLLAGRYEVGPLLGQGAMGKVWRCRDVVLQREVAIKTIDLRNQSDPTIEARFRREAVTMAGISHINVAAVYDAGSDGATAFLVMELLHGSGMNDVIHRAGPYAFGEGLHIGRQIADGLAAAHAAGVIHRDIKPGNIVFSNGVPKIVDFGIARLAQGNNDTLTSTSSTVGTAAYMSPEQCLGRPLTPASDMYSFGCLLFTMFTGRPPFPGEVPLATVRAQVSDPPPRLHQHRPDCPPALDAIVDRLLSKDPSQRPDAPTAAATLAGILTAPETRPYPTQRVAGATTAVLPPAPPPRSAPTAVLPAVRHAATPTAGARSADPRARGRRPRRALWAILALLLGGGTLTVGWFANHAVEQARHELTTAPTRTAPPSSHPVPATSPAAPPSPPPPAIPTSAPPRPTPVIKTSLVIPPKPRTTSDPGKQDALTAAVAKGTERIQKIHDDEARAALLQEWQEDVRGIDSDNVEARMTKFRKRAGAMVEDREITFLEYGSMLALPAYIYPVV